MLCWRVPRGFPRDHPAAEYLKFRQYLAGAEFPGTFATSPKFYPTLLDVFRKATNFADVVPAVSQPWYPRWSDAINVELTACLQGKITADQACDNMIAAVAKAKRA